MNNLHTDIKVRGMNSIALDCSI